MKIIEDKEFEAFSIPISSEAEEELGKDIAENGIKEPLVVWKGILVDGYKRLRISEELKLEFKTINIDFQEKEEVIRFRISKEFTKRNLSTEVKHFILGTLYLGVNQKNGSNKHLLKQKPKGVRTAKFISDDYKVGERTVSRAANFVSALDNLTKNFGDDLKIRILNRQFKKLKLDSVIKLAKHDDKIQKKIVKLLENENIPSYQEAYRIISAQLLRNKASKTHFPLFNKLYHGEAAEVLKDFPTDSVDCVLIDPPYNVSFVNNNDDYIDYDDSLDSFSAFRETCQELQRVLKPSGHLYCFFAMSHYTEFYEILSTFFYCSKIPLIWKKDKHNFVNVTKRYGNIYEPIFFCSSGERCLNYNSSDVLVFDGDLEKFHPSQKPLLLMKFLLEQSTQENEVVLDCYMGSGVALKAARLLKRKFIGIEKELNIFKKAKKHVFSD
jgi:site-specific DNA-methyltransferase (adenine-specific)